MIGNPMFIGPSYKANTCFNFIFKSNNLLTPSLHLMGSILLKS